MTNVEIPACAEASSFAKATEDRSAGPVKIEDFPGLCPWNFCEIPKGRRMTNECFNVASSNVPLCLFILEHIEELVIYPPSQKTTGLPVDECEVKNCFGEMSLKDKQNLSADNHGLARGAPLVIRH